MKHFNFIFKVIFLLITVIFVSCDSKLKTQKNELKKDGMVFIEGGKFLMGGDNDEARSCLLYTSDAADD